MRMMVVAIGMIVVVVVIRKLSSSAPVTYARFEVWKTDDRSSVLG